MRITRASVVVLLAFLVVPQWVAAQNTGRVRIVPQVGVLAPLNELGAVAPAGTAWYLQLGKADPTLALGTTVEIWWPSSRVNLRVSGLAALQSELKCGSECGSCVPELKRLIADNRAAA